MQIRGQFSDFFFETELPAMAAKVWKSYKAKPSMFKKFLRFETTTRSIEQFSEVAGVGLPTAISETEDMPVDSFVQGYSRTLRPLKYALGIACSQELIEDDKHGIVSQRSVRLGNSIAQAREIQGASVLNNAFDVTNYPGADLVALCSASHPLIKAGGVQSNLLASAADLDVTSLEIALTQWEGIKTHEGFLQMLPKPDVWVASENRWNVSEILKSQYRSDNANNTRNAFQDSEQGGAIQGVTYPYLTDNDAWYLLAPAAETEMIWLDRKAPSTVSDFIARSQTGYLWMLYRAVVGFSGWRGILGTPGA